MHVVVIADYAIAEGGAPEVAIASAVGLAEQGADVTFVHGIGEEADERLSSHPSIERIGLGGDDIWSKSLLSAVKDGVWNREYLSRLSDMLAAMDAGETVVHVHQWTKYFSPSVFDVMLRSGLPLAVSMHDYFLSCPTGLMYRFDTRDACELKPMSGRCILARCDPRTHVHKMVRVARGIGVNRAIGKRQFAAIHVSETGRNTIGEYLPGDAMQFVLENPVEASDHGARAFHGQSTLIYCGRLTEEKGVLVAATAARQTGVPIVFIGEGPARASILEANPEAQITGWLARDAVQKRVRDEGLAVIAPSCWPETGPLVVAEALAAGVPAIVSSRAGAAARIVDGKNGFVVEPDAAEMAGAIEKIKTGHSAGEMGANAYRSYWDNPPSLENHARGLLDIYKKLL